MMKHGRHIIKSHMAFEYSFTGIRLMDGSLYPVDWELTANLIAQMRKDKSKEESEYAANVAYQRLYYWLDINLPQIIMVDVSEEADLYLANLSSNLAMYCPGTPGDDLILQMLHCKLSTIVGDNLVVGEMHIKGSDTSLSYTFDSADGTYDLPAETKDYYEGMKTRDEIPWWYRNDGFCFEITCPESEKDNADYFSDIVDPMLEFDRTIATHSHIRLSKEPAKIIQIEKWKPKTI